MFEFLSSSIVQIALIAVANTLLAVCLICAYRRWRLRRGGNGVMKDVIFTSPVVHSMDNNETPQNQKKLPYLHFSPTLPVITESPAVEINIRDTSSCRPSLEHIPVAPCKEVQVAYVLL